MVVVVVVMVAEDGEGEGERLIEPSGSRFPPKFPSRLLKLNSFIRQSESLEESGT